MRLGLPHFTKTVSAYATIDPPHSRSVIGTAPPLSASGQLCVEIAKRHGVRRCPGALESFEACIATVTRRSSAFTRLGPFGSSRPRKFSSCWSDAEHYLGVILPGWFIS